MLLDNIRASVGGEEGEVDLEKSLNCAALNIVWNLVAGQRFLYDDPHMKEIVRVAGERGEGGRFYRNCDDKFVINFTFYMMNFR